MKKKQLLLLLSFLTLSFTLKAQWVTQPFGGPGYGPVYFIAVGDINVVWAKGQYEMWKTTDGGQTWQSTPWGSNYYTPISIYAKDANNLYYKEQYTGPLSGQPPHAPVCYLISNGVSSTASFNTGGATLTNFDYIYFFNTNNGVLLSGDKLYTTSNNGVLWTQVPTNNFTGDPAPITSFGVFSVLGNNIWATVNGNRVAKSTNNGLNWVVSATTGVSFESIAFKDSNNGIARIGTQLKSTSDGGLSWNSISYSGNLREGKLVNIAGTSKYICIGARGQFPNAMGYGFNFSNDNGNSWALIGTSALHSDIDFASPNIWWTGGLDEMHKFTGSALGLTEDVLKGSDFLVYPNPNNGLFNIKNKAKEAFDLKVLDVLGNIVMEQSIASHESLTIDLRSHHKGVYLLHISNEKHHFVKRIVSQ